MRTFLKAVLWFILGTTATYVATVIFGIIFMELAGVSQREGYAAMVLFFGVAPPCALMGGVAAATYSVMRGRKPLP